MLASVFEIMPMFRDSILRWSTAALTSDVRGGRQELRRMEKSMHGSNDIADDDAPREQMDGVIHPHPSTG